MGVNTNLNQTYILQEDQKNPRGYRKLKDQANSPQSFKDSISSGTGQNYSPEKKAPKIQKGQMEEENLHEKRRTSTKVTQTYVETDPVEFHLQIQKNL